MTAPSVAIRLVVDGARVARERVPLPVPVLVDRYERQPPCTDPYDLAIRKHADLKHVAGWELRLARTGVRP